MPALRTLGWIACVVYSTIPLFWFMIHPWVEHWRGLARSPFRVLLPAWIAMWIVTGAVSLRWRNAAFYSTAWSLIPAAFLLITGFWIYRQSGMRFSWTQLSGLPELRPDNREQRLVMTGIRARVRHPVYLAHLCEMVAWSVGTGLVVCWALTGLAILTGTVMIRMEDVELEKRFGREFSEYRRRVPAVLPGRHPSQDVCDQ
jgi:protein-S-isoprenylcysteine O-methyltransferase Ste14